MNNCNLVVALCGLISIILIFYIFDYIRTKNSGYKDKVKRRREKDLNEIKESRKEERAYFPNLENTNDVRDFFIDEVEFAEISYELGDEDSTIFHMGNAVAMVGSPYEFMVNATIPPHLYQEVVERFEYVKKLLEEEK
uniref:Uncharacterized protein n=1 Tax=Clastoptera arizonana TaxID=38151 RepID=A0A1B6DYX5_9HEMI